MVAEYWSPVLRVVERLTQSLCHGTPRLAEFGIVLACLTAGGDRALGQGGNFDGFGYLTPGSEKRDVMGCLFPTSVLPARAPEGQALLCCFIGGARRPDLAALSDEAIRQLVDAELATTLGITAAPQKEWIQRWERAIPQYDAGQRRREAALAATEAAHPGLRFHGAFRGGISLMHVLREGDALGRTLAKA
jgi:oxygen-dependent protoporphyrinogen oxidase